MNKNIKDYLHLYLGAPLAVFDKSGVRYPADRIVNYHWLFWYVDNPDFEGYTLKPILRPLSDMTEEEIYELFKLRGLMGTKIRASVDGNFIQIEYILGGEVKSDHLMIFNLNAEQFAYLLKQGFDLFGLIESGLAIDKSPIELPNPERSVATGMP